MKTRLTSNGQCAPCRARRAKIVVDPLTGLPVLKLSKKAAPLTSKQVEEILANFA
ncbi:MAG: hypothetical protein WAM25_20665 [Candidatus Acidiferrales bacterium]